MRNLKVKFVINKNFLVKYCIRNYGEDRFNKNAVLEEKGNIIEFQDIAWKKSKALYEMVCKYWNVDEWDNDGRRYIEELSKIDIFQKIYHNTEINIPLIEKEWEKNYKKTSVYISSLGIDLNGEFEICLINSALLAGTNLGNNKILWAYREDFPNYNTIYIWHEILHSVFDKSDIEHALIELITDNEIRYLLNGTAYPPFLGHGSLLEIKEKLNPLFQEYLKDKSYPIFKILRRL